MILNFTKPQLLFGSNCVILVLALNKLLYDSRNRDCSQGSRFTVRWVCHQLQVPDAASRFQLQPRGQTAPHIPLKGRASRFAHWPTPQITYPHYTKPTAASQHVPSAAPHRGPHSQLVALSPLAAPHLVARSAPSEWAAFLPAVAAAAAGK